MPNLFFARPLQWQSKPLPVHLVTLGITFFLLIVFNKAMWTELFRLAVTTDPTTWFFPISFFFSLLLAMNGVLTLLGWPYILKPILIAVLLICASASYFMNTFGVMIDQDMIRNALETDFREANELISFDFLFSFSLGGILPSWLILRHSIQFPPNFKQTLTKKGGIILLSGILIAALVSLEYKQYSIFFRNNRHVRHLIAPVNVIYGTSSLIKQTYFNTPKQLITIGQDAKPGTRLQKTGKKRLVVLVVGETARASNFSLQGYARLTNPRLSQANGFYFSNVTSCGTSTAASLPCMFSADSRENYSEKLARHTEGLLDLLTHAGVQVRWLDNNSGCKDTCNRVTYEDLSKANDAELCNEDGCFDAILQKRLEEILTTAQGPILIVLHQKGSHGPAYFKRYPANFKRFTPTCDQEQIDQCSQPSIVNTYDNTLLYTDHVLGNLIDLLQEYNDRFNSAMLYISDHGESLGENGVYLHGLPYLIAPESQTHVPMYAWFSPSFTTAMGLNGPCIAQEKESPFSHDHLFHTVLGLLDIQTNLYQTKLDMFAGCQNR
ncbi:MAG: phosphoethanolamine--lipid A transferase [Magnetococcus sp. DMHC-6]